MFCRDRTFSACRILQDREGKAWHDHGVCWRVQHTIRDCKSVGDRLKKKTSFLLLLVSHKTVGDQVD